MQQANDCRNWFNLKGTPNMRTLSELLFRRPQRWLQIWRIQCVLFFLQCKAELVLYMDWNVWVELTSLPWAEILKAGSKPMNNIEDNYPPWPQQPGVRCASSVPSVESFTVEKWRPSRSAAATERKSSTMIPDVLGPPAIPANTLSRFKPDTECFHRETTDRATADDSESNQPIMTLVGSQRGQGSLVEQHPTDTAAKHQLKETRRTEVMTIDLLHDYTPFCAMLLASSIFILPLPAIIAYWLQLRTSCLFAVLVCLTSINHWRLPKFSWRRTIDIVAVRTNILYHLYQALQRRVIWPFGVIWLLHAALALFLYLASRGLGKRTKFSQASMFHLGLHITAATGNSWICFGMARAASAAGN